MKGKNQFLTEKEYDTLEKLLGKLTLMLGEKSVCIFNGVVQDGYHIAIYNAEGERVREKTSFSIKDTVFKLVAAPVEGETKKN